jgi:Spy/CpxP family protein refolding chaperone
MDANRGSRKAILLVLLVFALGIALGSVGTYVVTSRVQAAHGAQPPGRSAANALAMFTKDLNLDPEQQKQILVILNDMRTRYAEIRNQADPQYEQARHEGREKIRQLLTPEQKPKFDDLLRRIDEARRQRGSAAHD